MQEQDNQTLARIKKLLETDKRGEARQLLIAYIQEHPQDASAWWTLSRIIGEPQRELECLKRVLALKPDHAEARQRLVAIQSGNAEPGKSVSPPPAPFVGEQAERTSEPSRKAAVPQKTQKKEKKKISPWLVGGLGLVFLLGIIGIVYFAFVFFSGPSPVNTPQVGVPPSRTPLPPQSLPPTWTPTATYTPLPTGTPLPTLTPLPTVPTFTVIPTDDG